ncbi:MFS transporter [Flavobacterium lindanitolerans]|uniref:UMF1 family MFS transporter n=1 Tax=Flavobacterium lindanitolerans TaxID=428988 RepID=A0A497U5A0_9FLAO|nr:MFS transporter [Flavobacterium lindanitolerans]PKW19951.1 UMF1 family MFS transporter [Flavobacterium lindanitolerans]RLJ22896.1 UMF1 family MFS transporter [Flavobacterium lindanitolerans]
MQTTLPKGSKKLMNAWAFYDWANSVYPLVISSAIFPLYFGFLFPKETPDVQFLGYDFKATALISFVTAFAFLVVAFISPFLSGIADFVGNKKRFLQFFCFLGASSCIGMYWFTVDNIYFGITCFFFGLIGFWGSLVFYNSYLPDIAFTEQQDGLSARGYSMGYIGSVILLLICLYLILSKEGVEALEMMKVSFALTGVWWLLFSQYAFYYLPKGNKNADKITKDILLSGFRELKKVKNELLKHLSLSRYLAAFFVYSMAVQTVMLVATYFGEQEINWADTEEKTKGLIISILVIQLVAVLGAIVTAKLSNKFGNIKTLIVINSIWVVICVCAYFVTEPIHFYVTACFVGLVMGGIQALSRSTYSKFLPKTEDTTSFFSFYDVAEKIGIVIGMCVYGLIDQITGSMRNSIVFLAVFFIVGVLLLFRVPKSVPKE